MGNFFTRITGNILTELHRTNFYSKTYETQSELFSETSEDGQTIRQPVFYDEQTLKASLYLAVWDYNPF